MTEINPPPTVDDEFDHEEPTGVDREKDAEHLQAELDRVEIVNLTKRVTALEEQVGQLRDLVRQLIDRVEALETRK